MIDYIDLVWEGALADWGYPGKPMHILRANGQTYRLNANVVGATQAEAVAWLEARLAEDAEQAALDALIGQEV